ncbi:MAG: NAD(P)H-binding protein, partial [Desulfuromonadales bacterium]|nr:NAD(P)H-binding protein [Desulfuromonadales bacterium]
MIADQQRFILIAGASGYVGARLAPRLLDAGYHVRTLARTPAKIASQPWGQHPRLQIVPGDVLDPDSLQAALSGCQTAFYLVHS